MNRFDDVYEALISTYKLKEGVQSRSFSRDVLLQGAMPTGQQSQSAGPTEAELDAQSIPQDGDRILLEATVKFSTTLIDNCANRSLYASSDCLNEFLNVEALSTLHVVLAMTLRLAQRYSASRSHHRGRGSFLDSIHQPVLSLYYKIDLSRVERLAKPFERSQAISTSASVDGEVQVGKFAPDLVTLVQNRELDPAELETLGAVSFSFQDPASADTTQSYTAEAADSPASPTPVRRTTALELSATKPKLITLSREELSSKPLGYIVSEILPRVPQDKRFELFCRARFAQALLGNIDSRREAVLVRLLAIANLGHIYPEAMLAEKVLQNESEQPRSAQMPHQLCSLVYPPGRGDASVPRSVQILALNVLEAFTNHKTKVSEVAQCLNINVSHGVLTYILRKVNDELRQDMEEAAEVETNEYCEALFSLLRALPTQLVRSREGMVNMGVLEILAESLSIRTRLAERNHIRSIASIDGLVFNTPGGFQSLVNAKGLDYMADLLAYTVQAAFQLVQDGSGFPPDMKTPQVDYQTSFVAQQLLRNSFRHVNHLMNLNIAGYERLLRNFIESNEMLQTLKTVIGNPQVFGSSVWSSACEVFSNFINSEPTSYAAVAESGLTKALLQTINGANESHRSLDGILPTVDAISCIPLAFGAICLNESGFEQLSQSKAMQNYLSVFLSPAHVHAMSSAPHDSVENLGAQFDELARHHPRLRPEILDTVSGLAARLVERSHASETVRCEGARLLIPNEDGSTIIDGTDEVPDDVDMTEANGSSLSASDASTTDTRKATSVEFLSAYTKFLLGFFTNPALIASFPEKNHGLERLVDLVTSPSLPPDFATSHTANKVWRLFQMLVDNKPHLVLPLVLQRLREAIRDAEPLGSQPPTAAFFQFFVMPGASRFELSELETMAKGKGTRVVRAMLVIRTISNILSRCLPVQGHRATANAYSLVNLADVYVELIDSLGQLQRRSIWETILLRLRTPAPWSQNPLDAPQLLASENLLGNLAVPQVQSTDLENITGSGDGAPQPPDSENDPRRNATQRDNLANLRKLLSDFPHTIVRLFASLGKSLLLKRSSSDGFQKQLALSVAEAIARNLTQTLNFTLPEATPTKAVDFYQCVATSQALSALTDSTRADAPMPGEARYPQILTLVATCFRKSGGLQTLSRLARQFFEHSIVSGPETELDSRLRLQRTGYKVSFDGLQMILRLLQNLTQTKQISEAPQSVALSREGQKDRPDYFSSAQFLVELRHDAINACLPIWKAELVDQASPGSIKLVCGILKNVLDGQGEAGAIKKSEAVSTRAKPPHRTWKPRHQHDSVARVKDCGAPDDLALEALYRCNDNVASAIEYCAARLRNPGLGRLPIPLENQPTEPVSANASTQELSVPAGTSGDHGVSPPIGAQGMEELLDQLTAHDMNFDVQPQQMANSLFGGDSGMSSRAEPPLDPTETRSAREAGIVTIEDLDNVRSEVKSDLMDQCLAVLESFPSLTFDLSELIVAGVTKSDNRDSIQEEASRTLVLSLVSLQGKDLSEVSSQVSAYAHLLGILLQEQDFFKAAKETIKDDFENLTSFIALPKERGPEAVAPWIGHVLLIVERMLSEDAQPKKIEWTPPPIDDPWRNQGPARVAEPLISRDAKESLYWRLLELLPRVGKDSALALAILRVFVCLTRDRRLASTLGQRRNLQKLFLVMRQLFGHVNEMVLTAFVLVLRHIVEDEDTVRNVMRTEIRYFFQSQATSRTSERGVETSTFTRQMYHLVLRQPDYFVEICNEMLHIPRWNPQQCHLALKPEIESVASPTTSTRENNERDSAHLSAEIDNTGPSSEKSKVSEIKPPVVENPDGVIHFLLSELLVYKDVHEKDGSSVEAENPEKDAPSTSTDVKMSDGSASLTQTSNGQSPAATTSTPKIEPKAKFEAEEHPHFVYRCFILRCLTELLSSYNRTKVEFINFSRKADPQASTPSKPRSGILNYLLNALIPCDTLKHPGDDIALQKKAGTSDWAIKTVVALCARTDERRSRNRRETFDVEPEADLLFVRRFVLEHALKAYRDANSSSDPFDVKYAKLLALADLFNRMLQGRPDASVRRALDGHVQDNLIPTQKQLAKIMFEKNFITTLTSSITDIDPKFEMSQRASKYILRPLKLLTHTAVELSLTSDISTSPGQTDEDDISSATSLSDAEDMREETPDLFRNSTLGMFQSRADDDESSSNDDEDGDEEMYHEHYDDEMEYDEDEPGDDEDVVSEEDEDMDGVGPIEGIPGDVPMALEIEIDDGHDAMSDNEDDDDDDDDDDMSEDEDDVGDEIEIMEEITGDENASLADGDEDDWEEDDDQDDEEAEMADELDDIIYHAPEGGADEDGGSENELEPFSGAVGPLDVEGGEPLELDDDPGEDDSDNMDEDEDDEFDDGPEDGYDEEAGHDEDESDVPPFVWGFSGRLHRSRGHRHGQFFDDMPLIGGDRVGGVGYRSHRPGGAGPRGEDETLNPLLRRDQRDRPQDSTFPPPPPLGSSGRMMLPDPDTMGGQDQLRSSLARLMHASDALRMENDTNLWNILSVLGQRPGGGVQPLPGGGMSFSVTGMPHHHHHHHHPHNPVFDVLRDLETLQAPVGHRPHPFPAGGQVSARDAMSSVSFDTANTEQRWQEEACMIFGSAFTEKCHNLVNSILRLLVPPAIEANKLRAQREEEERRVRAQEAEERRAKEEAEREEQRQRQEQERQEREEREAAARDAADTQHADGAATEQVDDTGDIMQGVEPTGQANEAAEADASSHEQETLQQPRVFVDLRSGRVDITDLGIDMEVLEALPEEMREEVITSQIAEHRSQQRSAGVNPSTIDNEFLDALPAEIREELLQQEARDRRRQQRDEERRRRAEAEGDAQPEEMNAADFMASLDPMLRQSVLAEADDEMLNQLPADIAAEARALNGHRRRAADARTFRTVADINADGARSRHVDAPDEPEGRGTRRPIVQMLDKAGVATLLRLMFMQIHGSARSSLQGILRNTCGNRQTRYEVLGSILSILQDGSVDASAVERSFANLTARAKQSVPPSKTPQSAKKGLSQHPGATCDATPSTVVTQCLETLGYLTSSVSHVPQYFLTENDAYAAMRSKAVRKGKNKDYRALRFPINSLLALLERDVVINNLQVMEKLASLLASVTTPLTALLRKDKAPKPEPAVEAASEPAAPGDTTQTRDVAMTEADSTSKENGKAAESDAEKSGKDAKKSRSLTPPEIPEENLRLVINLITASESNSKAFRDTLSCMTSLSAIPGARKVFGDELNRQAHQLAETIRGKLDHLLKALASAGNEMEAQSIALTIFPSAGSILIKISRVLAALDFLFEPRPDDLKDMADEHARKVQEEGRELLYGLYEDTAFIELWNQLGACMSALQKPERYFFNVATILLPLVEALMIACKRLPTRDTASLRPKAESPEDAKGVSNMQTVFFNFTGRHRKILNDLVRHNPKLMSGTFSTLAKNSSVLEFDNKRNYFNRRLHHRSADARHHHSPSLQLGVRRDNVFLDSYKALYFKTPEEIKYGKFNIRFIGEEGVDAGGVTREWFQVLARQMFNPDYALFNPVASDRTTFHPNGLSSINPEHLQFFKFIGRMIGKALYENRVLDCHFSRAVYKRILDKAVSMKDMETIDLDYTKGMEWILGNDITDVITETFSIEQDKFGVTEVIDLIDNGRNIAVTEENKEDYVRRVIDFRLTGAVSEQLRCFLEGFHDIVPRELIQIFDEGELELLISGMPDVDIDDWKNNTEYHNYNASSPQIQWFWRAVRSFDKEEVAKLLQFVTGAGKVPLNGFKELEGMNGFTRFTIHKDFGAKDRLPSSHTCFNRTSFPTTSHALIDANH